jgi:zinc transport system substrate-binding protein
VRQWFSGRMGVLVIMAWCLAALSLLCSCGREASQGKAESALPFNRQQEGGVVLTTFYPTEYFASRIAAGITNASRARIRVECPVPSEVDPIFWQPDRATIARYQQADLVIINGAEYEKWVATAALPLTRVVDTARPFEAELIRFEGTTHSHGAAGQHSHVGVDGHTWMDPVLATKQAEQVLLGMSRRWPEHAKAFGEGFRSLGADLESLDSSWKAWAASIPHAAIFASHPAYSYLARRYGLTIHNVVLAPDQSPSESQWNEIEPAIEAVIESQSQKHGARIMLFESPPLSDIVDRLSSRWGIVSVVVSPCEALSPAARGAGADYLSVMRENIDRLKSAVLAKSSQPAGSQPRLESK